MKTNTNLKLNLDYIGMAASTACAIHCAAIPLLLTFGSLGVFTMLTHPYIEPIALMISGVVAIGSMLPAYRNHHHSATPLLIMAVGFLLIASGRVVESEHWEIIGTVSGALAVAFAHYWNWRAMKKHQRCVLDD